MMVVGPERGEETRAVWRGGKQGSVGRLGRGDRGNTGSAAGPMWGGPGSRGGGSARWEGGGERRTIAGCDNKGVPFVQGFGGFQKDRGVLKD